MKGMGKMAFLAAAFMAALTATAEDSAPPRRSVAEVLRTMPKPQTSADGFVTVVAMDAPEGEIGFRDPLVQFAGTVVHALGRTLSLPELPRRREAGLVIYAMDGKTNDTRVIARASRRRSGPYTRIWLPAPGHSDIGLLRHEIARAYFRAVVETYRELPPKKGAPPPAEMPDWLVVGIVRQTDIEQSRDDMRDVLMGWSEGHFPYFPALCAQADIPPILAGYLAGWMREKALFPALLKDLAAGKVWSGSELARRLTEAEDAVGQDIASDQRLLRLLRKVISPGRTSRTDLRIFASRLLLYPPFYDKMFGDSHLGCTFRAAVALAPDDPDLRMAAARKAKEVPLYAIGRGEELQQASIAYMDFLTALARGAEPTQLTALLDEAEAKFGMVEEAVRKLEEEYR